MGKTGNIIRLNIAFLALLFFFLILLFFYGFAEAYQIKKYPDEVEIYEFSLTFPLDFSSQRVLSTASRNILDKVLQSMNIPPIKNLDPEDFVQRISIKKRELKPDGIEYTFVLSVDVKKLIFFAATGEKTYSVSISNCSFVSPIISRVLLEYTVKADISCYITYIEESSGISTLKVDISGTIGRSKSPFKFKRTYYFFSVMPYEQIYADITSYFESLGHNKIFKIIEQDFELDNYEKVTALLSLLLTKAYFYSVIPFEVLKVDDNIYKVKVLLLSFNILKDEDIFELLQNELQKFRESPKE